MEDLAYIKTNYYMKICTFPVANVTAFPDSASTIAFFICATRNYNMQSCQSKYRNVISRDGCEDNEFKCKNKAK